MFIVANGNNCIYIRSVLSLANKATLNTKAKEIKNTIPDTTSFITTPEFSRFTKLSFEARIKEGTKSLTSKSEAKNAFDLGDKNTEKIKKKNFKHLLQVIFIDRSYFGHNGSQNYLIFQLVFKCFTPSTGGDKLLV